MSYDTVTAQLGSSGTLVGFRYATVSEVYKLFQDAGIPDINTLTYTVDNYQPVNQLMGLLGATESSQGPSRTIGITGTSPNANQHFLAALAWNKIFGTPPTASAFASGNVTDFGGGFQNVINNDVAAQNTGSFLVRIPEPPTLTLTLISMALVGFMRARVGRNRRSRIAPDVNHRLTVRCSARAR